MECGSYRGIKLLEHAMKVVKRIFENRIRQQIDTNDMQFGFIKGKGATDAIFIVRQMQAKFRAKGKKLYFGFVDLIFWQLHGRHYTDPDQIKPVSINHWPTVACQFCPDSKFAHAAGVPVLQQPAMFTVYSYSLVCHL